MRAGGNNRSYEFNMSPTRSIDSPKHRPMLWISLTVSLLSVITNIVSLVNQVVIAKEFGAGRATDLFLTVIGLPNLVIVTIAGIASQSLVPLLVKNRLAGQEAYRRFCTQLIASSALFAFAFGLVSWLLGPPVIAAIYRSLGTSPTAVWLVRLSWLTVCMAIINQVQGAIWSAEKRFIVPAAVRILPYACMIVAVLAAGRSVGVVSMAAGLLAGYVLALPCLASNSHMSFRYRLREWILPAAERKELFGSITSVTLSIALFAMPAVSDPFWAGSLGVGALSHLAYGQRILVALGNLLVLGPASVVMPSWTEDALDGNIEGVGRKTQRVLTLVMVCAFPAVAIAIACRVQIVRLMFMRSAFLPSDVAAVAHVLPLLLIGMISMVGVTLLFRTLYSMNIADIAAKLSLGLSVFYFAFSGVASRIIGTQGIALAYAVTWTIAFALTLRIVAKRTGMSARPILSTASRALAAALISVALVEFGRVLISAQYHQLTGRAVDMAAIFLMTFLIVVVYCSAAQFVFKVREVGMLMGVAKSTLLDRAILAAQRNKI